MKQKLKSSANRIQHISNLLNQSKTKITYSFNNSTRFLMNKSFSPNHYYDLPSSLNKRSCSFGVSSKTNFSKKDYTQPARYNIPSSFDSKQNRDRRAGTSTFGISRQEYYKPKQKKDVVSPNTYKIADSINTKNFYIAHKLKQPKSKNHLSSFTYNLKNQAYNNLSTYRKNDGNIKMKTQYYPKGNLYIYDNGVPGPGSYSERKNVGNYGSYSSQRKKANSSFGIGQKVKYNKPSNLGPGKYKIFSQFGNNL